MIQLCQSWVCAQTPCRSMSQMHSFPTVAEGPPGNGHPASYSRHACLARNTRMLVSIILENSKFLETGGKFLPLKEFMFLASAPRSFRTAPRRPRQPPFMKPYLLWWETCTDRSPSNLNFEPLFIPSH